MAIIKLSGIEKRKISTFTVCFFGAVCAWLFFALANKAVVNTKQVLVFKNFPQQKSFYSLQPDTVIVTHETAAWQAILANFNPQKQTLQVDLNWLKNKNHISFSKNLLQLNKQNSNQKIIGVQPNTLFFDFEKRFQKKIPVKFISKLSYNKQFNQSQLVNISPKFVTVTGPKAQIDKLSFWPTQTLQLKKITATVVQKIALAKANKSNVSVFPEHVNVNIPVDEFTEKNLEIPITVTQNPNYYTLKLYPSKVMVKLMVPLKNYHNISADDFEAQANLSLWAINKADKLPVKIINKLAFAHIVQVYPHQVDYIIKK